MLLAALVVSVLALLIALAARSKAAAAARGLDDARSDARRWTEGVAEEMQAELATLRQMLAQVASGDAPTPQMIRDGQLWRDVSAKEGEALVAEEARVIDVRTPGETAGGVVPGAVLIPIDQLEERRGEIPQDGKPTLIVCAGGGRSAAACEFLSREGYTQLHNLTGGMGAWTGQVERPS